MTKKYCDKCEKELKNEMYHVFVVYELEVSTDEKVAERDDRDIDDRYDVDLCNTCYKDFRQNYIKNLS